MLEKIFVEKIKTLILCLILCLWKSCRLLDSVKKYGAAIDAIDDNAMLRSKYEIWMPNN